MGCSVGTYFTAYLQAQTHKALLTCRIGLNCSLFQACSGRFRNHTIFPKMGFMITTIQLDNTLKNFPQHNYIGRDSLLKWGNYTVSVYSASCNIHHLSKVNN